MKRTPEELAAYLFRELSFPERRFLMTGTGVVPPDDFSLQGGDIVSIQIEGVGTLTNPVAAGPSPIAATEQR
jgi:2-dehydro-3-deoxy-D-arabinonate dehydratase